MASEHHKLQAGHKLKKSSLDKDLSKIARVEDAARAISMSVISLGAGLVFLAAAGLIAATQVTGDASGALIVVAAILGGYMALNIGANDVANNVAPAVGSRAMTLMGALVIAAIFEAAGALLAGGDVVKTISKGIIDPSAVADAQHFIWAMMAALFSSALWINLATYLGAPVSTTHAVVGGVVGAGIAAAGFGAVQWDTMLTIAASWVISPLLGGVIAAAFLAFIKTFIIYQDDKIAAARRWVPMLLAIMAGAFAAYLMMKGLKKVWTASASEVTIYSLLVFAGSIVVLRPIIRHQSEGLENRNQSLRRLFHIPLIFAAALLSFAHGANDVANAVGPLAAIIHASTAGDIAAKVHIPLWVMVIGAFGISLGLFFYGPRLVKMVGEQITKMNPMRAYCVALSAAITVIVASALGLPVSSTHIAVGAVFGVGFFREWYTTHSRRRRAYIRTKDGETINIKMHKTPDPDELLRRKLVRRSHFMAVVAAWIVTVPASAALAAALYYGLSHFH
ncbi:MAG: inorganic phosphate transporter [Hyphomicrobiaceae bacterium]|nr:inorganic phosphate transporter [Hyphomicrobiaceae bacterium]MCC0006962.1 inorganic phosphate transporter [Hyphomicrobiaceae bacterium]